jgi:hypothetical protein
MYRPVPCNPEVSDGGFKFQLFGVLKCKVMVHDVCYNCSGL